MRGINLLHPKMRAKAEQLQALCQSKGLALLITETWRSAAEQDALYAQGRTKPGKIVTNAKGVDYQSAHQWGVAFDFCKNIKGQEYSDGAFFTTVGAFGKSIGLFWGGDFRTITDKPHFELPEFMPNNSTATLKSKYGTPDKFKDAWPKEEETVTQDEFDRMWDNRLQREAQLAGNSWTEDARKWAVEKGFIAGDGKGNYAWRTVITKELLAQMLFNVSQRGGF